MKYMKMLGLLALAMTALMAFANSASATRLTDNNGGVLGNGTVITAVNENGHVSLTGAAGIAVECSSHIEGVVTKEGGPGTGDTVEGHISKLSFFNCTNGYVVHVEKLGTLVAHTEGATSNNNGTITSTGTTVTVTNTPVGSCGYLTNNTDIGVLTGSKNTAGTATFDINASIPRHAGSFFCGSSGIWEGNYLVEVPDRLNIH